MHALQTGWLLNLACFLFLVIYAKSFKIQVIRDEKKL